MPMDFVPLDDNLSKEMREKCLSKAAETAQCAVGPWRLAMPSNYKNFSDKLLNMEVKQDDVWLVTYPRSGTTWCQEIIWLICNNCDTKKAKSVLQYERFPFLELSAILHEDIKISDTVQHTAHLPSPRLIKSHLPEPYLPKRLWAVKPKIVYVCRNPRDAAISYYYQYKLGHEYVGSLELFLDAFMEDKVVFSPYWKHVLTFWNKRHEENVFFLSYEEMKKDLRGVILRMAKFLNKELTEKQISIMLDYLDIKSMKTNTAVNQECTLGKRDGITFIREGKTGGWKETLSEEYKKKIDEWIRKNIEGSDFPYYLPETNSNENAEKVQARDFH